MKFEIYNVVGLKDIRVVGSRAVDYDYNYIDGSPVIGHHPVQVKSAVKFRI